MTTATALILNSVLIVGVLIVLALVMRLGHRAAGSSARPADSFGPIELERRDETRPDFERAA